MFKKLLCVTMTIFSCYGMTSKDSDEAWEKWGKEDPDKPLTLLEQWKQFNIQPISTSKQELTDGVCGAVEAEPHFTPNENIARLNGAYMVHTYPSKCKEYYMNIAIDLMVAFIVDLSDQKLLNLDLMFHELLSLKNEKNKEAIDKLIEKIKNLKGK